MQKTAKNVVIVAGIGLLVLMIWRSPPAAAADVSDVFANVWDFIREALQKLADFFGSLGS